MCPGQGKVKALLSDFDLVQEATSDDQWARLGDEEPDGTRGMKAPEVCKQRYAYMQNYFVYPYKLNIKE